MEHGNSGEVEEALAGISAGPHMHRLVTLALSLALERHNPQRELVSRLISDLYSRVLTRDDIARGLDDLLATLDDVVLDTPDAHVLLGQFMARCVADDCLAPKYITTHKETADNEWIKGAVEKAEILLSMKNGIAHLDNIWGVGGGNRPVKSLTNQMVDLLKEYLCAGDENEAMRCLVELDVPHFHHELVYQACDMVIEDSTERVRELMVALLKLLTTTSIISTDQLNRGMRRVFDDIPDINLDVPAAYTLLEELVSRLKVEGVVGEALVKDLPQAKGRKRFVSEGDGGKLKTA
jgi:programmed cell death protein 4